MKKASLIRLILLFVIVVISCFLLFSSFSLLFLKGLSFILGLLTLLWIVSLWIKDASIIDIFWGLGFVLLYGFYACIMLGENVSQRQVVFLVMVGIWGLRLTAHLAFRNIGKGEDYRYAQWRKEEGEKWWWLSFFRVFALQGFLLWIIASPFVPALSVSGDLVTLDYFGIFLWSIGFFFEAVGDWQLQQFKTNPDNKGKVMNKGLWRYTRHPNYFGDALLWWGFFCFSLAHAAGFLFLFSPVFMTFLLMKVSGVAMLEKSLKKTKPKYQEYIDRTSAFFPMPPKG